MKKCKWYSDCKAPVVLSIDDLSFGYLDLQGIGFHTSNDWGYGCRRRDSIFTYFEQQLLSRFPEIKYTVFLPFGRHSLGLASAGHECYTGDIYENPDFEDLLRHILATGNEIAWHGHNHGKKNPTVDPATWCKEYEQYSTEEYSALIKNDLAKFFLVFGVKINGGRFPCYKYNETALKLLVEHQFRWWSFDFGGSHHEPSYKDGIYSFPTNYSGDMLNYRKSVKNYLRQLLIEKHLLATLHEGKIINITEHFLSTRPDGKRQTPNIFDDIYSLNQFFSILRGQDVWYATCSQIANYADCHENAKVEKGPSGTINVTYTGRWNTFLLSVYSDNPYIKNCSSGEIMKGKYKNGQWLFSLTQTGEYRELKTLDA